ncbi:ABC transporter ATP-binding protein [Lichenihabitans sp. PAMC28606]|uniref:ABC transporter ATP-binding protein n=1 Tax=Lichenihabitans sp. PAMC28606 TaxID=2880932 RepID=UPI001D0A3F9F|nr:ABC transporter ATP-binding protein [Lichenihabitans sp. PAMC28606]UDL95637.1 ABC transporter ATP-binding protein [Lichenihabitans sp. PAMC28606]
MSPPILDVQQISLAFRGIKALTNLSFSVERGEICALIGPNGAGKSSLLNIINGVYRASSGRIVLDGEPFERPTPMGAAQSGIGRTFQNNALFHRMSVLDNVLTGLTRLGRCNLLEIAFRVGRHPSERRAFRKRADEIIGFLEIGPYRDTVVGGLPYGLQKRVEVARALVASPKLLLLDEPMAGMNADEKTDLSRLIAEINRVFGTTVVLIEHDIGVVMGLSHHVVVLDYGRKVGDGTPAEVRRNPDVVAAYLGTKH